MPRLVSNYYWREEDIPVKEQLFRQGYGMISEHKFFLHLDGEIYIKPNRVYGKKGVAVVEKTGKIYVNTAVSHTPKEWVYVIAHCLLHLAFGHFDDERIPKDDGGQFQKELWNSACDIYITRFLYDIAFGTPVCDDPAHCYSIKLNDEQKIYEHLRSVLSAEEAFPYGTNGDAQDMLGLEHPILYKSGEKNAQYTSLVK